MGIPHRRLEMGEAVSGDREEEEEILEALRAACCVATS